ncbi:hypothetical protein BD311DRAFT_801065 [Dichomitus squalens]|uniref:Uncharacterized protein n=1 Tax=Dichomitus squalens TaxID=114155 RepID=A0A4Q9N4A2_9APHY|nr:hypothetical protein BD311DRAFT_801065 [Dichomitus squalens]
MPPGVEARELRELPRSAARLGWEMRVLGAADERELVTITVRVLSARRPSACAGWSIVSDSRTRSRELIRLTTPYNPFSKSLLPARAHVSTLDAVAPRAVPAQLVERLVSSRRPTSNGTCKKHPRNVDVDVDVAKDVICRAQACLRTPRRALLRIASLGPARAILVQCVI